MLRMLCLAVRLYALGSSSPVTGPAASTDDTWDCYRVDGVVECVASLPDGTRLVIHPTSLPPEGN